jgi:hypothetical protein
MRIVNILKKFYKRYYINHDPRFNVPVSKQLEYIKQFKPSSKIERSLCQEKAQKFVKPMLLRILEETYGIFKLLLFKINCFLKSRDKFMNVKSSNTKNYDSKKLVILYYGIEKTRVPNQLIGEYNSVIYVDYSKYDKAKIFDYDVDFINRSFSYKKYFYLKYKTINKISLYRAIISEYSPSAIATMIEFNSVSSILTQYLNEQNIKHINFMHGDKQLFIRDSFTFFNEFYIWDDHYRKIFETLGNNSNYITYDFLENFDMKLNIEKIDFTYYLAGETKTQLKNIVSNCMKLSKKGYTIELRPHPRWTNQKYLKRILKGLNLKIQNDIDIYESIASTRNVISLFSTVLLQSAKIFKNIIIDDISDKNKYDKLKEMEFIGFSIHHMKLSYFLDERGKNE